ncbi:Mitochondrial fission 1 protein A-like protein [Drosera capensis]
MDAAMGKFFDSSIEQEVAKAANEGSDEECAECITRLSWALVHSRLPEDVHRGIAMLEALLANASNSLLQKREKVHLLAVDCRPTLTLKKTMEDRIAKDGVIGIGLTATAVGVLIPGIAAALARKG